MQHTVPPLRLGGLEMDLTSCQVLHHDEISCSNPKNFHYLKFYCTTIRDKQFLWMSYATRYGRWIT
jgi:hypothetical protein